MFISEQVPLSGYSTMRLGGNAAYLTEIDRKSDIAEAVQWAKEHNVPMIMIGDGSNIVWRDEGFPGLVIVNKIRGLNIEREDEESVYVSIGAGENWDEVVEQMVNKNLNGIAELSLIPGTAGATPVQNVGAYGREISETLVTLEAFDTKVGQLVNLTGSDCNFSYRSSRFKTTDRGRFFITSITLMLSKASPAPPFYESLQTYFREHGITEFTPQTIRQAVIAIRSAKLPDPKVVANNGSFFANPFISSATLTQLLADYPGLKYWNTDDGKIKVAAAWLVEQAGFKDVHDPETGMGTWPSQALVLVNEHAKTTADLLSFKQKIVDTVKQKFDITLEQEPELLPQQTT